MRECSKCNKSFKPEQFSMREGGKHRSTCKGCDAKYSRLRRWKRLGREGVPPEIPYKSRGYRGPIGGFYTRYELSARKRGHAFELTYDEFEAICLLECSYCGKQPEMRQQVSIPVNGIDRVDNSAGYTLENCVPCCSSCNRLKGAMSVEEFLETLHRICEHMSKASEPAD